MNRENLQEQVDPRERMFMMIVFIVQSAVGSVLSTNNLTHHELDVIVGFSLSFSHL